MYILNRSTPPDFKHDARAMSRPVLIYRHIRLRLEILFAAGAFALRRLLAPEDRRRHFGPIRTRGGQSHAL